jgi:hypothetical protein
MSKDKLRELLSQLWLQDISADEAFDELEDLINHIKRLEEALAWYEYTVLNCYCHGSEGDAARDALRKDQGRKAKEAKL